MDATGIGLDLSKDWLDVHLPPGGRPSLSFVDRERARTVLAEAGLDALVVAEPEPFRTITGVAQGVAGLFRRAGAGFAVLPADPALPIGVVVGDLGLPATRAVIPDARSHPLWIEHARVADLRAGASIADQVALSWQAAGRAPGFARPATFDLRQSLAALGGLLWDRGLADGRLGFDFDFIATNDAAVIRAAFRAGQVVDGSPTLSRLLMVKTPPEVERLTLAAGLAEAGLRRLAASAAAGQAVADLHALFRQGVADEAATRGVPVPPSWDYISIGPEPWGAGVALAPGVVVKADVGCVVDGYSSDLSRNFVFGAATSEQTTFHAVLERAFAAGLAAIRPGVPLKAAHRAATAALHEAGLAGFSRGHFGHGLGHGVFSEQWPFIAADAETLFEPGMVMAFEVPIYVDGVGGFNLEDQFIVERDGARLMSSLPLTLLRLG